jgi:hypothetical protein
MIGSLGQRLVIAATLCLVVLAASLWATSASGHWSSPLNLSQSEVFTEDVSAAADSQGRVHVVWSEGGQILHRHQLPEGWSAPVTVAVGFSPYLAADVDGQLHLVFVNRFADVDDVYYASWREGVGWQLPVNVSEGVERSACPSLAIAADGTRAVAWGSHSGDLDLIYVAVSEDGVLWSSGPVPQAFGVRPKVAVCDADLLLAWQGPYDVPGSAMEIFFSRKSNHQWTLPIDVSASPDVESIFASLTVEGGKAYLAWQEDAPSGSAVFISMENAGIWSVPQQRSGETAAYAPAVAVGSGGGHLAWTTGASVKYAGWTVSSGVWQPTEDVAVEQAGARNVRIALGSSPFLAWLAEAGINNDDVYCSIRTAEPTPTTSPTQMSTLTATPTMTITLTPSPTPTLTATHPHQRPLFLPIIRAQSPLMP